MPSPIPRENPTAQWIRRHYGVPAYKHRRIAYTGDPGKGRQLGTIVGFVSGGHLRIRLDGQRILLRSHPTWAMEYLPEMANEHRCQQCARVGTRGFRIYATDPATGAPAITVCANTAACAKRRAVPGSTGGE